MMVSRVVPMRNMRPTGDLNYFWTVGTRTFSSIAPIRKLQRYYIPSSFQQHKLHEQWLPWPRRFANNLSRNPRFSSPCENQQQCRFFSLSPRLLPLSTLQTTTQPAQPSQPQQNMTIQRQRLRLRQELVDISPRFLSFQSTRGSSSGSSTNNGIRVSPWIQNHEWISVLTLPYPQRTNRGRKQHVLYLLGTQHGTSEAHEWVQELIDSVRPNHVLVELDASRNPTDRDVIPFAMPDDNDDKSQKIQKSPPSASKTKQQPSSSTSTGGSIPKFQKSMLRKLKKTQGEVIVPVFAPSSRFSQESMEQEDETLPRPNILARAVLTIVMNGVMLVQTLQKIWRQRRKGQPGESFVAVNAALRRKADVMLFDRPLGITLDRWKRALAASGYYYRDARPPAELTRQTLRASMALSKERAPAVHRVTLQERDEYMAAALHGWAVSSPMVGDQDCIWVAIAGMAHVDGMEQQLQQKGWKLQRK